MGRVAAGNKTPDSITGDNVSPGSRSSHAESFVKIAFIALSLMAMVWLPSKVGAQSGRINPKPKPKPGQGPTVPPRRPTTTTTQKSPTPVPSPPGPAAPGEEVDPSDVVHVSSNLVPIP